MATPQEIVERAYGLFLAGDVDGIADLLAEDVVIEHPFAPPEIPPRIEGRDSFCEHLSAALGRSRMVHLAFDSVVVHQTADPEVIVVEFTMRGRLLETEKPVLRQQIQVVRVRDGKIVLWRDYFNPLALSRALEAAG